MSKVLERKQNPSGHVTFDSQQTRFFQECNAKINKIDRKRECGMLVQKPSRNPILVHEPEPRNEFLGFDFSVPHKGPEPERWKYPENDWGLMAKFRTQKHIYDDIQNKADNYKSIVEKFRDIREKNEKIFADELLKEKTKFLAEEEIKNKPAVKSPTYSELNPNRVVKSRPNSTVAAASGLFQEDIQLLKQIERAASKNTKKKGDRTKHNKEALDHLMVDKSSSYNYLMNPQNKNNSHNHSNSNSKLAPIDFFDHKISTIRDLGSNHPEVLAKWRTERAVQFVDKKGNTALHPPPRRATGTKPFHPAGNSVTVVEALKAPLKRTPSMTNTTTRDGTATNSFRQTSHQTQTQHPAVDTAALALNMNTLQAALEKTNADIDRQRLKIALNTKPEKGFQKAKDARVTARDTARG